MQRISFILILLILVLLPVQSQTDSSLVRPNVYLFKIFREIGSTSWIHTQKAFKEAEQLNATCIVLHLNTYGGQVVFADSIRTKILNSTIPVHVFIDNNAASAGALISIACDSIYMRAGANIGAATVVDQSGQQMPDKYQSYMRSTIRATAEAQGKIAKVENGDTTWKWRRDPHIAEAMVDETIYIPNVIDSGKVLTLTTREAIELGFCEGEVNSLNEVLDKLNIKNAVVITYKPTFYDGLKGFLTNPIFQGVLILVILGGLYFELQTPGIGFPLIAALIAAVLYFSPLYIDGLAENWEILIFLAGLILIGVEVFVIPGFGVTGIAGITLVITGLTLSLINNVKFDFSGVSANEIVQSFLVVFIGFVTSFFGGIWLTNKFFDKGPLSKIALQSSQDLNQGYIGIDEAIKHMIGDEGVADTILRPAGKVLIAGEVYDAIAQTGYINEGENIIVVGTSSGQLIVRTK
jgi:membrane-bound serine protease (ClpP class)